MPSNPVPRAIVLLLLAMSTCAVVGVAAANTGAAPTAVSKANLKLKAKSYLMSGKRAVSIPGARVAFKGSITPLTTGDQVLVQARRGKKTKRKVKAVAGVAGKKARFTLGLNLRKRGRWTVTAQRVGSDGKPNGDIAKTHVWVVKGHAGPGWRGMGVRALQRRLAQLGYISPSSGHYSGTTGRAVLAFRKVNRMARVQTANSAVFRKLAKGGGAYKLRYPKAGKHVEFDWSRQVVVLARGSKPVMTITTSSGSPVTPTAFGKFKFWLKQAGYNQKQMYYSTYFHNGQAIHGFSDVPNQPASHGCLRIPIANAIRVYNWLDFGDVIYTYR